MSYNTRGKLKLKQSNSKAAVPLELGIVSTKDAVVVPTK
jgi:hypothetical protein